MVIHGRPDDAMTLDRFYTGLFDRYDDRTALVDANCELTYSELDEKSARFANVLDSVGLGSGDLVGILLGNRSEYIVTQIGAARAGVVAVPFNHQIDRSTIKPILEETDIRTLVVGPEHLETIQEFRDGPLDFNNLIGVSDEGNPPLGVHSYEEMLDRVEPELPSTTINPSDVAAVHYTGGTTGQPKGALHTHYATILNMYAHLHELEVEPGVQMLLATPLGHSAGKFMLAGLMQGGTIHIQEGFDSARILATIEEEEITWTYLVPTMVGRLLDDTDTDEYDLETLDTLVYGSAPIPPSRLSEGLETFGDVFIQFYGLTEVPNLVTVLPKDKHETGDEAWLQSAGLPAQLVELRIFDSGTKWGDDVGEIGVRSPYAVDEYLNRGQLVDDSDWIRTGDVGYLDESGRLHVLDRIQDIIMVDDEPVYSTEVESIIQRHPDVRQVAVIGVPKDTDRARGTRDRSAFNQRIKAIIVPETDADITVDELRAFCEEYLTERSLPDSIDTVGKLPETPYGKVDKRLLREPYW